MENSIFYSWQSDLSSKENRYFIQDCLKKASFQSNLNIRVEQDTQGISGTPDIAESILKKIASSQAFIADLSITNVSKIRSYCNPNVLFELGCAVSQLGWDRIILLMNIAYGKVEELPFDLRTRRVLTYRLSKEMSPEEKKKEKDNLINTLKRALQTIFEKQELINSNWWGTWKTFDHLSTLNIRELGVNSFCFDLFVCNGAIGQINNKYANCISDNLAVSSWKEAYSEDNWKNCELIFQKSKTDLGQFFIQIKESGDISGYKGDGVSFDGEYYKVNLAFTNYLHEIELTRLYNLLGTESFQYLCDCSMQVINYNKTHNNKVIRSNVQGIGISMQSIIIIEETGSVYCAFFNINISDVFIHYFSTDPAQKEKVYPEIQEWKDQIFPDKELKYYPNSLSIKTNIL